MLDGVAPSGLNPLIFMDESQLRRCRCFAKSFASKPTSFAALAISSYFADYIHESFSERLTVVSRGVTIDARSNYNNARQPERSNIHAEIRFPSARGNRGCAG